MPPARVSASPGTGRLETASFEGSGLYSFGPSVNDGGMLDEVIPYSVEQTLHNQWCAMGVADQLTSYVGDHVLTSVEDQSDMVNWLNGRFTGQAAPSNC
jgi:hypothetical protein